MKQVVTLHGGPWHGRTSTLEDSRSNHFHIQSVSTKQLDESGAESLQARNGMYSRVGKTEDFEWDGWVDHE